jgi:subtilisin family serine protease
LKILGASTLAVAAFFSAVAIAGPKPTVGSRIASKPIKVVATPLNAATHKAARTETVIVRLKGESTKVLGTAQRSFAAKKRSMIEQQDSLVQRLHRAGVKSKVVARTNVLMNAIFLEVAPSAITKIAADPSVERVTKVRDYELDLSETVPYIGATVLQASGFNGAGVRVAVIDSGIDYKHANLGGSGDPAEYEADDPTVVEAGSFPTAKVVGGYDFVGQVWPNGDLAPDPDPIDHGGHGTHVSDIIGGLNGVAPGASLYALQVCSAVASSCSGVALIQAMDWAADPNGDGDPSDHVDVINMSLGSNYGQPFDDDLVFAVENATALGILTVASAGNGSDHPYVTGTPAAARSALSVAQTAVPSEQLNLMEVLQPAASAGDYIAVHQAWSAEQTSVIEGPVTYGNGSGGNLDGCAAFAAGEIEGEIVLVDRGTCNFSQKIQNIEAGGGILGIIGLIAPGEPFSGAFGGGPLPTIPGYMITQAAANILRAGNAVVRFDPANVLSLAGSVVSTSSRGPRNGDNMLKPEIGAPGASVSAVAGSGTETAAFGGTSGAAPMVSGSAALLLQARRSVLPPGVGRVLALKALLMNNAELDIRRDYTGALAEISRIGSGEVRVDRAASAPALVVSANDEAPALSFGHIDVNRAAVVVTKRIKIKNLSNRAITYRVSSHFRFADDAATGAVEVRGPQTISVGAGAWAQADVTLKVYGNNLPNNFMSSGDGGDNPANLTANEFDGHLLFDDGVHPIHLPWHVIPRKAADVHATPGQLNFARFSTQHVTLNNRGPGTAQNELFSLIGLSANLPAGPIGGQSPTPDLRAIGVNTAAVPAGYCSDAESFVWSFAVNTHERQTHLLPVIHSVLLDIDRDGNADYEVDNLDLGYATTGTLNGIEVTFAQDLATGNSLGWFYTEHATNTGNTILRVCAEQIGLTGADLGTRQVDASVTAFDFYFGGPGDVIDGLTLTPGGERYTGTVDTTIGALSIGSMTVTDNGGVAGNSAELGSLLITNSDFGAGLRGGATQRTEATIVPLRGVTLPF